MARGRKPEHSNRAEGAAAAVEAKKKTILPHRLPVNGLAVGQVEAELELVRDASSRRRLLDLILGQEVRREARRRRGGANERLELLEKGPPAHLARRVSRGSGGGGGVVRERAHAAAQEHGRSPSQHWRFFFRRGERLEGRNEREKTKKEQVKKVFDCKNFPSLFFPSPFFARPPRVLRPTSSCSSLALLSSSSSAYFPLTVYSPYPFPLSHTCFFVRVFRREKKSSTRGEGDSR